MLWTEVPVDREKLSGSSTPFLFRAQTRLIAWFHVREQRMELVRLVLFRLSQYPLRANDHLGGVGVLIVVCHLVELLDPSRAWYRQEDRRRRQRTLSAWNALGS